MQLQSALGAVGTLAVLGTVFLLNAHPSPTLSSDRSNPGTPILLVEGDARALRVTHVFAKPSAYQRTKAKSRWQVVVYDGDSREIGRYPMDLSAFDLNPNHVGKATEAHGCEVIERKVNALVNIPDHADASFLVLEHNGRTVGEVSPRDLQTMRNK